MLVTVALLAQPSEPTSAHDPGARIVIAPDYPALAFALPNGGNVHVDVTIDDQGKVTAAKAVDGSPLLFQAALTAAKKWEFVIPRSSTAARLSFKFKPMPKDTPDEEVTTIFMPPYEVEVRRRIPKPTVNYKNLDKPGGTNRGTDGTFSNRN